jgi:hypothetical protein
MQASRHSSPWGIDRNFFVAVPSNATSLTPLATAAPQANAAVSGLCVELGDAPQELVRCSGGGAS